MKHRANLACIILALLLASAPAAAVVIKIGSIAPSRSPWDDTLKELAREWLRISNGQVELKIYPGGITGTEEDMTRKMRVGLLGGAVLTNIGLTKIYSDVYVLNTPFLFSSEKEMNYVLEKMKPTFEKALEEKGFKIIVWAMSGWVNFFSKNPVRYPDDLKKHKLSFTTGEPEMEMVWKKAGFIIVPNEIKDMMMGLQSGMVNAFYLPPLVAASGQYFPLAPYMCSLRVAPLLGGIILTKKVWDQIPEQIKPQLMSVPQKLTADLYQETNKLEKDAIRTMLENGLKIVEEPADALDKWRAAANQGMDELIGQAFSKEIWALLQQYLKEFHQVYEK